MLQETMSARSGIDKQPKIKGLVKRCRSFKEDIMSRLARNRSLGKDEGAKSPSGWTSGGTSPVPSDMDVTDPILLIAHRLKEAYLTLQFVESLIQKNCVDLLGGSSNVMLDLIGCLLNDMKKTSATDTRAVQSAVSQIKSALSDFLTAVDALLLKSGCDDAQRELYFEKILESLKTTREALSRLKLVMDNKENGHYGNGARHHSTSGGPLLTSTPIKTLHSPTSKSDGSSPFTPLSPLAIEHEDKRPPLPPKLKQWSAKSFDSEWSPSSPSEFFSSSHNQSLPSGSHQSNTLSPQHQSLLNQWLEQTSPPLNGTRSNNSTSSATSSSHRHHHHHHHHPHHHQRSLSQHHKHGLRHQLHSTSSASRFDDSFHGSSGTWTESAIYVARSTHSAASSSSLSTSKHTNNASLLHLERKQRTYSDSYQLEVDSQESLDKLEYENFDSRSGLSGATHNSQSLSLGSSLDNLLLVDSQPSGQGLSPHSNTSNSNSGGAGNHHTSHRISLSSNLSGSGTGTHGLTSLSTCDPDADVDLDPDADNVFISSSDLLSQQQNSGISAASPVLLTKTRASAAEEDDEVPPALPEKQSRRLLMTGSGQRQCNYFSASVDNPPRCPSPYENVDETDLATWPGVQGSSAQVCRDNGREFMSYSESRATLVGAYDNPDDRPPLPPKKKHSLIAAYVEFLHNYESLSHHHNHFQNHLNQAHHHQHRQTTSELSDLGDSQRRQFRSERSATLHNPGGLGLSSITQSSHSTSYHQFSFTSTLWSQSESGSSGENPPGQLASPQSPEGLGSPQESKPPALPPKKSKQLATSANYEVTMSASGSSENGVGSQGQIQSPSSPIKSPVEESPVRQIPTVVTPAPANPSTNNSMDSPQLSIDEKTTDLYLTDAYPLLIKNDASSQIASSPKGGSEGPEIKGGEPYVLIVYAASPDLGDNKFREVFLLTYRTFVRPMDVVNMLWRRYQHFVKKTDRPSLTHARATLDLFVDVVNSLTPMDLEDEMVAKLRSCVYHLVSCGEIQNALKARKGLIGKYQTRLKLLSPRPPPATLAITAETQSLLQWTATSIAQQMTLMDAELFRQLEPAELLLWAREQSEDFCPALNHFTEHFNKVSYWARSKVLLCNNARERDKTMKKMIQVMRKLREYNNFNSLLAVLAALDSAPIRRLGSKRLTETLKPHAALTDSSGSFRCYRQALSESKPPCIPYIGLVLQDLTFVHIGNADLLPDKNVNWVKRWQQWIVLEPVRRFHSCNYSFKKNDPLLTFLNNFDESLNDDDLWQLSESIKPRGNK